jgi:hypothetical protein
MIHRSRCCGLELAMRHLLKVCPSRFVGHPRTSVEHLWIGHPTCRLLRYDVSLSCRSGRCTTRRSRPTGTRGSPRWTSPAHNGTAARRSPGRSSCTSERSDSHFPAGPQHDSSRSSSSQTFVFTQICFTAMYVGQQSRYVGIGRASSCGDEAVFWSDGVAALEWSRLGSSCQKTYLARFWKELWAERLTKPDQMSRL